MLETIVYRKIIDFLQPLISKSQFGFIRRRSCLSQLLDSFNYIFEAVENNSSVEAVYLDFRKAFALRYYWSLMEVVPMLPLKPPTFYLY